MKVTAIAETETYSLPYYYQAQGQATTAERLIEFAGRNCYQSWDASNPCTAKTRDYIRSIIKKGHLSVLEHASVTFLITDASTACLGQLTRHRHFSYSVESARFVDKTSMPVRPTHWDSLSLESRVAFHSAEDAAWGAYGKITEDLMAQGFSNKEARQEARLIIPQGTPTKIVVSGNLRAWREFLQKRLSPGADVEIREMATKILDELHDIAPSVFEDLLPSDPSAAALRAVA